MSIEKLLEEEITVLSMYNPATTETGIKVHHDAAPELIAATDRLHQKGLISLPDGGYLTNLGQTAVNHLDALKTILK